LMYLTRYCSPAASERIKIDSMRSLESPWGLRPWEPVNVWSNEVSSVHTCAPRWRALRLRRLVGVYAFDELASMNSVTMDALACQASAPSLVFLNRNSAQIDRVTGSRNLRRHTGSCEGRPWLVMQSMRAASPIESAKHLHQLLMSEEAPLRTQGIHTWHTLHQNH
jgi:hypothetical protein